MLRRLKKLFDTTKGSPTDIFYLDSLETDLRLFRELRAKVRSSSSYDSQNVRLYNQLFSKIDSQFKALGVQRNQLDYANEPKKHENLDRNLANITKGGQDIKL